MDSFALLLGHLTGDYIVQNDWMAANKTKQHFPCLVHCVFYTLAVWLFTFHWITVTGLLICFAFHYPIDRYRLARAWMKYVAGQEQFATGQLFPWSMIVVDNIFHLLTLYGIWLLVNKGLI